MSKLDSIISKAYYDPSSGFVGINKLYRKLKDKGVKQKHIADWLARQEVYQVNKKNNRKQTSFIPRFPKQEFQIDLIYLENEQLNQASYGLCCIDAFTKQADIELMKTRTKIATVDAMMAIFDRMGIPTMIYCDEGSEFTNKAFQQLCKELGIRLVFTLRHAPIVERFNRTIKEMIERYLQSTNTKTITTVLKKMLNNYNNSYHSSIGMAPNEVNEKTMHIAQINLVKHLNPIHAKPLKVGDKVRVQVKPKSFVKGYKPKYSKEIYTITVKGRGYYETSKDDREYSRSNLQKVRSFEINPEKPDLEGTAEGRLRNMKNLPKREYLIPEPEPAEEVRARRSKRERRPIELVSDPRYGKVNWS